MLYSQLIFVEAMTCFHILNVVANDGCKTVPHVSIYYLLVMYHILVRLHVVNHAAYVGLIQLLYGNQCVIGE